MKKIFSDLIRAFPHKPIRENLYSMVMYEYDSNKIQAGPIKNRQAATIANYLIKMHKILKSIGRKPKVYIMDNECSSDLK